MLEGSGHVLSLGLGVVRELVVAELEGGFSLVVGLDDGIGLDVESLSDGELFGGDVGLTVFGDVLHVLGGHGGDWCGEHSQISLLINYKTIPI